MVGAAALGAFALRTMSARGLSFADDFTERVTRPLESGGVEAVGSARLREQLIDQAWQVIGQYPITGIGPGAYHQDALEGQGVHVVPLMLWAETGLAPAAGWVILVCGLAVAALAARRTDAAGSTALIGMLVAVLATHLTSPYMYGRGVFLPLILVSLLLSPRGPSPQLSMESRVPARHATRVRTSGSNEGSSAARRSRPERTS